MNRYVRFGLSALIVLVLAPVLLLQGLANAPLLNTVMLPLGSVRDWNGFRVAELALGYMKSSQQGLALLMGVQPEGVNLARQAFAEEPLAMNALFVLAVDKRAHGDLAGMQAIVDNSLKLDKRNRNIGALQMEQAALSGNIGRTFAVVDRMATVHPDLTGQFLRPLISSLIDPRSVAVLADALKRDPVWANGFWQSVPNQPDVLTNYFAVRQLVKTGTTPATDTNLLQQLVASGLYPQAFALWKEIGGQANNPTAYVPDSSFPPFGWDATTTAERAMTDQGEGSYSVYIQPDTGGELGRQLLQLQPGSYSFSAKVAPASQSARVQVRLQCVTARNNPSDDQPLDKPVRFTVDASSCPAWWLILQGDSYDSSSPLQVTISDMKFQAGT